MALTDDIPIKVTAEGYRPAHDSSLREWLLKEADGGIKPEDNEDTPKKPAADLYADPPNRQDGQNLDSRWGEKTKGELDHHNDNTYAESKKDRRGVVADAFNKLPQAEKQDGAAVSALLDCCRTGRFATHSVALLNKAKLASPATLSERVRRLTGRV